MKEFRTRIIIILAAVALCVYLLYPTYADYNNQKEMSGTLSKLRKEIVAANPGITKAKLEQRIKLAEDSIKATNPDIAENRQKRIKLGLDLQGGMRVVLEVNTAKLLEKIAQNPDKVLKTVIAEAEKEALISDESVVDIVAKKLQAKGIRLSRYFGTVREDDDDIVSKLQKDAEDAVNRAMEIVRNRVDQYGVSEPSIQRQGSRRLIVELPGIANEEEAKQLLQGTALLEFKLVKDPEFTVGVVQKIDDVLAGKVIKDTTNSADSLASADSSAASDSVAAQTAQADTGKQLTAEEFKKQHPFASIAVFDQAGNMWVNEDDRSLVQVMLNRPEVQETKPSNVEFLLSAKPITVNPETGKNIYQLYCVKSEPELTGGVITNAQANIDPNTSQAIVNMEMNTEGATEWSRITGANINKRIAIVLDGVVYSAPNVINKIPGGRSQITGMDNMEEAKLLEIILKAGALPAPVNIIEERTVGPSLGQDSISKGINSALIGYVLVAFFMLLYYQKAGGIAGLSLLFTILFILAALAGFGGTLTMPGIAGVVLSIGMAVDSNVLIYERIREEMALGKTLKSSISSGFSNSFSAIFDSNVTTLSTGIILYQFGSGPIQGFAITLMIGIVASLFSSLIITRLIFDYMADKGYKISIG